MKKKTIRRSLSLLCAFALLFSLSISAAAAGSVKTIVTDDGTVITIGAMMPMPKGGIYHSIISDFSATAWDYHQSWSFVPSYGIHGQLNVWNEGSIKILYTLTDVNNKVVAEGEIAPGDELPMSFTDNTGAGLGGSYTIYLNPAKSGEQISFTMSVMQYTE